MNNGSQGLRKIYISLTNLVRKILFHFLFLSPNAAIASDEREMKGFTNMVGSRTSERISDFHRTLLLKIWLKLSMQHCLSYTSGICLRCHVYS